MNEPTASFKKPPQNIDAEISVLGGVLVNNAVLDQILDVLEESDFYKDSHRVVYTAMREMHEKTIAIDYLTLEDHLRSKQLLESCGGAAFITSLTDAVPTTRNIMHYAGIVRDKAIARRLIAASTEILQAGLDDPDNLEEYLDQAEKLIFDVSQKRDLVGVVPIKDLVRDSFDTIEKLYERKELYTGTPTGFKDLDDMTSGFQAGDLVIIAGRPSMGKTAFALNIAQYAAKKSGPLLPSESTQEDDTTPATHPVLFFSLEMSKEALTVRMLCTEARVDSQRLRRGMLTDSDWAKLARSAGLLSEADLFIDDTPAMRIMQMRAKARRLQAELRKSGKDLSMIMVDYLQLASPSRKSDSREREISEISRSLKSLAKELNVPVIALSQLSRRTEARESKRPQLADLRESGAIEQDADVILFVYRDEFYNQDSPKKGVAEIIVGKQRNGPTGTVELHFSSEFTRFENLAKDQDRE